ncbi:MAG: hypothetical protein GY795_14515 [Desulfobacterales bacterium]|nr:hypothetical protein [Desulfobacterales bacterium]
MSEPQINTDFMDFADYFGKVRIAGHMAAIYLGLLFLLLGILHFAPKASDTFKRSAEMKFWH